MFDPGFSAKGLLTTYALVRPSGPDDRRTRNDWANAFLKSALTVKGVRNAATSVGKAPKTHSIATEVAGTSVEHQLPRFWGYQVVSPDYLRTMRIPVLRGRGFTPQDRLGAEPVAVIGETTAKQIWPNDDPLGYHIQLGGRDEKAPLTNDRQRRRSAPDPERPRGCGPDRQARRRWRMGRRGQTVFPQLAECW